MIKQQIEKIIFEALEKLTFSKIDFQIDRPKVAEHGDFSTNVAMALAKRERRAPLELAQILAAELQQNSSFKKIEVKAPGFINFFFQESFYQQLLAQFLDPNLRTLPISKMGQKQKVLVEFVSANPTGPMHIGHGRNAAVGDSVARLLEAVGYQVQREFYINDHGVQIATLGRSGLHYFRKKIEGAEAVGELPDGVYQGDYIEALVEQNFEAIGRHQDDPMQVGKILSVGLLEAIQKDLARLDIYFDNYFSESSLYDGSIAQALQTLKAAGHVYEEDSALWFRTTAFGDDKDRVLIKKDGSYTYLTPDIAYHYDKFLRGFDIYLNILGADHGGYVARIKAAVQALGFDAAKLEVLLMQLVNLKRGGQIVSMSKRSGDYVTLHEVLDEVGADATRFFFLMRSHRVTLDFDLELAKQQNSENPVFYVQYAHARICSIFAKAQEAGVTVLEKVSAAQLQSLKLPEELELIRVLLDYAEIVQVAAQEREPHRIVFYLMDLVKVFQNYYTQGKSDARYRVISDDLTQTQAKLFLIFVLRQVLRHGFKIIGITAPDRMKITADE